jgi:hypothetical protein
MNMRAMVMAGLVLVAGGVGADEGREKLAGELLVAMGAERQAGLALEQMRRQQEVILRGAWLPPGQEEKSREMQQRVMQVIEEEFAWEKWRDQYARFYAETFTEPELKELLTFYRSPAGRTYVEKSPQIQQRAQGHVLGCMTSVNARVQAILKEYARPARPAGRPTGGRPGGGQAVIRSWPRRSGRRGRPRTGPGCSRWWRRIWTAAPAAGRTR